MACGKSECLYTEIWQYLFPSIIESLEKEEDYHVRLNEDVFQEVGNRKSYSFRLTYNNGCLNSISNSAVARDLADVLGSSTAFRKTILNKNVAIRMGKHFDFHVEMS